MATAGCESYTMVRTSTLRAATQHNRTLGKLHTLDGLMTCLHLTFTFTFTFPC